MTLYRFDEFTFDSETGRLERPRQPVRILRPKSAIALTYLLDHAQELVTQEQLVEAIWPDRHVVDFEAGLSAILRDIRRALDDSAADPQYLETSPRRGYRFLREARVVPGNRGAAGGIRKKALAAAVVATTAVVLILVSWRLAQPVDALQGQLAVAPITVYSDRGEIVETSWLLTDTLIEQLWRQRPPDIEIIGRSTLERGDTDREMARAFGSRLGVDWVLYGFVRERKDKWTLTLHLYRMPAARLDWTVEFDSREPPGRAADELARKAAEAFARRVEQRN